MEIVILTALGVGFATVLGAVLGFAIRSISHAISDYILALSAGVMLASAVTSLILPSIEHGGTFSAIIFIFVGAIGINLLDRASVHLYDSRDESFKRQERVMMFVSAIAVHNLPEGIAAGVGFGTGDVTDAILIAGGIALHNIPEGMVIIAPMIAAGMKPRRALAIAMATGFFEVIGTLLGYFAVNVSRIILPPALAIAGGMMLYVISDEMIPETHADGNHKGSTYALIFGFCLILAFDALIS
ncbi:MAG: ZIP family metal transporter [Clostridia bacterium]|nr:ZIP family metal transporter [Clostridia bacterium]